jgi:hypothetical protein
MRIVLKGHENTSQQPSERSTLKMMMTQENGPHWLFIQRLTDIPMRRLKALLKVAIHTITTTTSGAIATALASPRTKSVNPSAPLRGTPGCKAP